MKRNRAVPRAEPSGPRRISTPWEALATTITYRLTAWQSFLRRLKDKLDGAGQLVSQFCEYRR